MNTERYHCRHFSMTCLFLFFFFFLALCSSSTYYFHRDIDFHEGLFDMFITNEQPFVIAFATVAFLHMDDESLPKFYITETPNTRHNIFPEILF